MRRFRLRTGGLVVPSHHDRRTPPVAKIGRARPLLLLKLLSEQRSEEPYPWEAGALGNAQGDAASSEERLPKRAPASRPVSSDRLTRPSGGCC